MYMKLKDGKSKVVTLSYDDGVVHDKRLIQIMDKYGLKGTFNINTDWYLPEDTVRECYYGRMNRMTLSEAKELYIGSGHEVAIHGFSHSFLNWGRKEEVFFEVLEDKKNIEQQFGVVTRGMAYPYGTYNDAVVNAVRLCGISYARTAKSTASFSFPEDWLIWHPTCHHKNPRLMELAKKFVESGSKYQVVNSMFYLWGHSYEFYDDDNWELMEEFGECIGGKEDIWYATNIEIFDYVQAYERLQVSVDGTIVHNPSAMDVWFVDNDEENHEIYCVKAGQTLCLG